MVRLFKYGLSKELVAKGENKTAITEFEDLHINAKFKVWKPMNDYEYNQMLTILTGAGILSKETGIEKNTESSPDELIRVEKERQSMIDEQIANQERQIQMSQQANQSKGGEE